MMKTYNVKLVFEDEKDKNLLLETLEMKKEAFNIISKARFNMKKCGGPKPLHQRTYKKVRKEIPQLPAQHVIKAIRDVIAVYKTIRQNNHIIDEPPKTDRLFSKLDKRLYKWLDNKNQIKLTTHKKRISCSFKDYDKLNKMFEKFKMRDPALFVKKNGDAFLSLVFEDNKIKFKDNKKSIGIDLGIKRLTATSEGMIVKGNEFNGFKRRIRHNKRQLQSKSRNSHSARTKLSKLRRRERNFSKNYTHHVVNNVLKTEASTIVLEDLSKIKRNKGKGRRLNNRLSQVPFFMFKTILTYKAQALGKRVVTVKPHFTSQNDFRGIECGKRMGCRYYGSDGKVLDADLNAANNILLKGTTNNKKRSVSCCCAALDGQAYVNRPIVEFLRQAPSAR